MTTYINLVNAGVDFLVSMQEYYGTDRALAVWDNMRNILGEDLAGDVFFKILSGDKTTVNIENYKIENLPEGNKANNYGYKVSAETYINVITEERTDFDF